MVVLFRNQHIYTHTLKIELDGTTSCQVELSSAIVIT